MKLFETLKTRKTSFIIIAVALLSAIVGLALYLVSQSIMSAKVSPLVLIFAILAILLDVFVLIVKDFDGIVMVVASAITFLVFGLVISSQLGNLGYYFAGIEDIGFGIMPTFVVSAISYVISLGTSLTSIFLNK